MNFNPRTAAACRHVMTHAAAATQGERTGGVGETRTPGLEGIAAI